MEKHETMTFLRMYYNNFPIVLNINHSFSNFEETWTHFYHIWILYIYYIYIIILLLLLLYYHYYLRKQKEGRKRERLWETREAPPESISIDKQYKKSLGESLPCLPLGFSKTFHCQKRPTQCQKRPTSPRKPL